MSRDKRERRHKNRLPPFVPLLTSTLDQPAWRVMSHGAQMLYVAIKRRYSSNFHNNGKIFLAQRTAAKELHSHHNQIARWFRELQHFGFIVMQTPGCLGVDGKGQAPRWRLTENGMIEPDGSLKLPTRDYELWDGTLFVDQTKSRAGKAARSVQENRHSSVQENRPPNVKSVLENRHKEKAAERAGKPAQIYITTPDGSRSAPEGSAVASEPSPVAAIDWTQVRECSRAATAKITDSIPDAPPRSSNCDNDGLPFSHLAVAAGAVAARAMQAAAKKK